jgi:hypothetical protein
MAHRPVELAICCLERRARRPQHEAEVRASAWSCASSDCATLQSQGGLLAQPAVGRLAYRVCMPVEMDVERRSFEGLKPRSI